MSKRAFYGTDFPKAHDGPDDLTYITVNIANNTARSQKISAFVNYPQEVINDGRSRYLSVVRFVADGTETPIMFFDSKIDRYWVNIHRVADNTDFPIAVAYDTSYALDPSLPYAEYNPVYTFEQFAVMVNNALQQAQADAGLPASPVIQMYYSDGKYHMCIPAAIIATHLVSFNKPLFNLFNNFHVKIVGTETEKRYAEFADYDFVTNPALKRTIGVTPYFDFAQSYVSTYLLFDITRVAFSSTELGAKPQLMPGVTTDTQTNQVTASNAGGGNDYGSIIADFVLTKTGGEIEGTMGQWYYAATPDNRLIDCLTDHIKKFDLNVYLFDNTGKKYDAYVGPFSTFQILLLYVKKELYKK